MTHSIEMTEWEAAVQSALVRDDRTVVILPAAGGFSELSHPQVDLMIDLSESGAGMGLAETLDVPIWLLCHGPDIRIDLTNSILSGFVSQEPFIEVRLIEWRPESQSIETVCKHRLRSRKTPGRSIAGVKEAAADWFCAALVGSYGNAFEYENDLHVKRGTAPASWRIRVATLYNLARIAGDLFSIEEWNVGTVLGGPEHVFKSDLMSRVNWLPPNPTFCFRADPFGWPDEHGKVTLLYEAFDFRKSKGWIVRNIDGEEEEVSDFPHHASYPFLIDHNGQRYAVPELSETARPMAFPIDTTSAKWTEEVGVPLMGLEGVPLVDGSIIQFEDRYWLFGTKADQEPNAKLFAWHAPSPFGPWTPHQRNPIKFDITSSRPGGTPFLWQGNVVRPAQDCSTTYGAAVVLNQIEVLTPTAFKETPVARIEPDKRSRYPTGAHTLSITDGVIILDAKRHVFHPFAPFYRWKEVAQSRRRANISYKED